MAIIDNLDDDAMTRLIRRVDALEKTAGLGKSSVSEGETQFIGTNSLLVSGSAAVTGLLQIFGELDLSGTFVLTGDTTASGDWTQTGSFTLTGPFTLDGDTTMTGNLTATGDVTLNGPVLINGALGLVGDVTITGNVTATGTFIFNGPITINGISTFVGNESHTGVEDHHGNMTIFGNLDITAGGKITAGVVYIDNGGTYGGRIGVVGATLELAAPTVLVQDLNASNSVFGHSSVESDNDVIAYGSLKSPNIGTTTSSANVFVNSAGFLIKVTSARRFKKQIRLAKLDPRILDVRVRDWQDKFDPEGPRVPGVIAEEVEAAGGELFVGHTADGKVESVAYDRLAMARTQLLAEQLDAALKRIDALEKTLAA